MKLIIALILIPLLSWTQVSDDSLRVWYAQSVKSEDLTESLIEYLDTIPNKSGLQHAFLASAQGLMGKYSYNPYYKLDYVKQCQSTFDLAISKDPNNPEIRFMRLAVEHYVPAFLGYSKHIDEDLIFLFKYLIDNKDSKKDTTIYSVIKDFVLETKRLNEDQAKELKG